MRLLNLKDVNNNEITDSSYLELNLDSINTNGSSNWDKLLIFAKKNGAKKCFLKLKSLAPLFRIEYTITFDKEIISKDYNFDKSSTLNDAFFLRYIAPKFTLVSKDSQTQLNWMDIIDIGIKSKHHGKIMMNTTYICKNIPDNFKKISVDVFGLKIKVFNSNDFLINIRINPLDKNGNPYLNKDIHMPSKEEIEQDNYYLEEFEYLIQPFSDIPYKVLEDIFKIN